MLFFFKKCIVVSFPFQLCNLCLLKGESAFNAAVRIAEFKSTSYILCSVLLPRSFFPVFESSFRLSKYWCVFNSASHLAYSPLPLLSVLSQALQCAPSPYHSGSPDDSLHSTRCCVGLTSLFPPSLVLTLLLLSCFSFHTCEKSCHIIPVFCFRQLFTFERD